MRSWDGRRSRNWWEATMDRKNAVVTWRAEAGDMLPADVDAGGPTYIFLKLEAEFVLSAGMDANVNRAIVPYSEYAKLGDAIGSPGIVEFWFNSAPGASDGNDPSAGKPDHAISGVRIIDVEPVTVATVRQPAGENLPADVDTDQPIIAELRLYLADMRERIAYPRGGRLFKGKINPKELKDSSPDLITNRLLVHKCVLAMGVFSAGGGNPG